MSRRRHHIYRECTKVTYKITDFRRDSNASTSYLVEAVDESRRLGCAEDIRDRLEKLLVPELTVETKALLVTTDLDQDDKLRNAVPIARLRQEL